MRLVRVPAEPPRFEGDFRLVVQDGQAASADEQSYMNAVAAFLSRCADDEVENGRRDVGSKNPVAAARRRERSRLVASLSEDVDEVARAALALSAAQQRAAIAFGRYREVLDQLDRPLFTIRLDTKPGSDLASELFMDMRPAQSEEDPQPSEAQRQLFVAVSATSTVVSRVHANDVSRKPWRIFGSSEAPELAADRLRDEFLRKLHGVARVGLEGNRPAIATLALVDLRDQYTGRVAGRIKNGYARSLGIACLVAALACLAARTAVVNGVGPFADVWWANKHNFFMLFFGAAMGTWMSFLVRRVSFAFDELAAVEADLLEPGVRILFVLGLTMLVGLLFWTDAVQIGVGGMRTSGFRTDGGVSVLIGAFCGLSERSLATAIAGRAAGFIGGLTATETTRRISE